MKDMRKKLFISRGSSKHDKLVASTIKFLIKKCDASPLDIETEKKIKIPKGNVYIDVVWKGKYIECMASIGGVNEEKIEALDRLKLPIILAVPTYLNVKTMSRRLIKRIKGVLVFDIEEEKLFKTFDNLDEYLGYMLLGKPEKTLIVNL